MKRPKFKMPKTNLEKRKCEICEETFLVNPDNKTTICKNINCKIINFRRTGR